MSIIGVRVFCPDDILPPLVVIQLNGKFGPCEDPVPSRVSLVTAQVNNAGLAMTVVGTAAKFTTILVDVAHIPPPLTVTE